MKFRRSQQIEIARYYQRQENIERRRKEAQAKAEKKKGFFRRLLNV